MGFRQDGQVKERLRIEVHPDKIHRSPELLIFDRGFDLVIGDRRRVRARNERLEVRRFVQLRGKVTCKRSSSKVDQAVLFSSFSASEASSRSNAADDAPPFLTFEAAAGIVSAPVPVCPLIVEVECPRWELGIVFRESKAIE